jgi:hypothetical protein
MSFYRINVTVIDGTRPFAESAFNVPLILGTTTNEEATKDTLKVYSSDDLDAIAEDFPVTTSEYKTAARLLAQDPHPDLLYMYSVTRSATPDPTDLSTALGTIVRTIEENHYTPFYFLGLTEHEEVAGDTVEVSDWISARTNVFMAGNKEGLTAQEIITLAQEINSDRVIMTAHTDPDEERMDAGLLGYWAGMPVGSVTLDTKPLNAVTAADWTSADMAAFMAKEAINGACIPYIYQAGVAVTVGSWTTSGPYADLRRCKDWLVAKMEEALFGLKLQNPKVPQTDHGRHMVQHCLEGVLNRAASMGIVQQRAGVGRWEVDIPTLDWLSHNDPQALIHRHLRTIRIRVWPVGAWEAFTVLVYLNWEAAEL